ncbi:hypothetical protein EV715DRAFT_291165 [Schizophyllum commune]
MAWIPKVSMQEAQRQLCAPGSLLETENVCIDGRVLRAYKNLPSSCRAVWLHAVKTYPDREFVVFEDQRHTFRTAHERAVRVAAVFRDGHGIRKGDHVGLVAKNLLDYLNVFWACHLVGAVPVLVNALLPADTIKYCLAKCHCKLIVLDWERASLLEHVVDVLVSDSHASGGVLVIHAAQGKGGWRGMHTLDEGLRQYTGDPSLIISEDPEIQPDDNAVIFFTSGTTGLPKGALSTQRAFLSLLFSNVAGTRRAEIRRGEESAVGALPELIGILLPIPLFHITGMAIALTAAFMGAKVVLMRKYTPKLAVSLIKKEHITSVTAVPTIVSDLIDLGRSELAGHSFSRLAMAGAPVHKRLARRAKRCFPNSTIAQAYGLTETNAPCTFVSAEDFVARPLSCGYPTPVTDILIVDDDGKVLPPGDVGEIWVRGPHLMKEYYDDPEATAKVFTKDGWFKTGDVGVLCAEGFLYIRDRKKDMIIRGGENIDCTSIENALYAEPGVLEAAAVGVPDERLGELPVAVVSVKKGYHGKVSEQSLISMIQHKLPRFAVPVMILIWDEELERNAAGKVLKNVLRKQVAEEWEKRKSTRPAAKL